MTNSHKALTVHKADATWCFQFHSESAAMDPAEIRRREEFLKRQQDFKENAFKIIHTMLDWCNITPRSKHLVDEILHSIFFLGKINQVPFSPEEIIPDEQMLSGLREKYPRPFEFYLTQLPRRSPFSCVMDMIVMQKQPENENQIMQSLRDFITALKPDFLVSSTICVSQKSNNSVRHYGVSMSTSGRDARSIVIGASCLSAWDEYVAGAVMTYYVKNPNKKYFDFTIKIPDDVRCEAFSLKDGGKMKPCRSCGNMFGLNTDVAREWPYGNCAEVESLSNLLKNEIEVKEQSQPKSDTWTPQNIKRARENVLKKLKDILHNISFNTWDGHFYVPQAE
ncbi:uncharacterized protein LOC111562448 [Amphiprion ocellaris]|uniref:uncharacterized protein LOC111562448 n=1 Tax=Amphiprion ocellaris TaxID=80972 RepID=UPI002410E756|nr:uncharacterized protein LOC111562448 [Amphiprion ocellaris]